MTFRDPSLGESRVFRAGSWEVWGFRIVGLPAAVLAFWLVLNPPSAAHFNAGRLVMETDLEELFVSLAGCLIWIVLCLFLSNWEQRLELVVGERGFRYWRPSGWVEVPWTQVNDIQVRMGYQLGSRVGHRCLQVVLESGQRPGKIKMGPNIRFDASWLAIWSAMQASLGAARAASGWVRDEAFASAPVKARDGKTRPSQRAVAMARAVALESSLLYGERVVRPTYRSIDEAHSRGLDEGFRPNRWLVWGPLILGFIPIGLAGAPLAGHFTAPSPGSLAYASWHDPLQSLSFTAVAALGFVWVLCWAYAWWNYRLLLTVDERGLVLKKAWRPQLQVEWRNITSVGWKEPGLLHGGGPVVDCRDESDHQRLVVLGGVTCALQGQSAVMAIETGWERWRTDAVGQ